MTIMHQKIIQNVCSRWHCNHVNTVFKCRSKKASLALKLNWKLVNSIYGWFYNYLHFQVDLLSAQGVWFTGSWIKMLCVLSKIHQNNKKKLHVYSTQYQKSSHCCFAILDINNIMCNVILMSLTVLLWSILRTIWPSCIRVINEASSA